MSVFSINGCQCYHDRHSDYYELLYLQESVSILYLQSDSLVNDFDRSEKDANRSCLAYFLYQMATELTTATVPSSANGNGIP